MIDEQLHNPNLMPALDAVTLFPTVTVPGFSDRDMRALFERSEIATLLSGSHQISFLASETANILQRFLQTRELAEVFETTERSVERILQRSIQDPSPPGRHRAFDDDIKRGLIQMVTDRFHRGAALTNKEPLKLIREEKPTVTKGWVHAFIGRHLDAIQVCRSRPQEDTRMIVPRTHLEEHFQLMKSVVEGKLSELVFNLDEVGFSDWEDRKPRTVIVPPSVSPDDVYHPVSRKYRHSTLLACVSAAGDALTPMIIVGSIIPDSLWDNGPRHDEDAMVRSR
jgi:hypothetical protein